jgi:hypothetical protein
MLSIASVIKNNLFIFLTLSFFYSGREQTSVAPTVILLTILLSFCLNDGAKVRRKIRPANSFQVLCAQTGRFVDVRQQFALFRHF